MARLVGLLLLIAGIWLGISIYTEGTERTLGRLLESEDALPAPEEEAFESVAPERQRASSGGRAAPSAVTSRVRERVTGAIAEGARRHGGE
jgi:hypothetical protein